VSYWPPTSFRHARPTRDGAAEASGSRANRRMAADWNLAAASLARSRITTFSSCLEWLDSEVSAGGSCSSTFVTVSPGEAPANNQGVIPTKVGIQRL